MDQTITKVHPPPDDPNKLPPIPPDGGVSENSSENPAELIEIDDDENQQAAAAETTKKVNKEDEIEASNGDTSSQNGVSQHPELSSNSELNLEKEAAKASKTTNSTSTITGDESKNHENNPKINVEAPLPPIIRRKDFIHVDEDLSSGKRPRRGSQGDNLRPSKTTREDVLVTSINNLADALTTNGETQFEQSKKHHKNLKTDMHSFINVLNDLITVVKKLEYKVVEQNETIKEQNETIKGLCTGNVTLTDTRGLQDKIKEVVREELRDLKDTTKNQGPETITFNASMMPTSASNSKTKTTPEVPEMITTMTQDGIMSTPAQINNTSTSPSTYSTIAGAGVAGQLPNIAQNQAPIRQQYTDSDFNSREQTDMTTNNLTMAGTNIVTDANMAQTTPQASQTTRPQDNRNLPPGMPQTESRRYNHRVNNRGAGSGYLSDLPNSTNTNTNNSSGGNGNGSYGNANTNREGGEGSSHNNSNNSNNNNNNNNGNEPDRVRRDYPKFNARGDIIGYVPHWEEVPKFSDQQLERRERNDKNNAYKTSFQFVVFQIPTRDADGNIHKKKYDNDQVVRLLKELKKAGFDLKNKQIVHTVRQVNNPRHPDAIPITVTMSDPKLVEEILDAAMELGLCGKRVFRPDDERNGRFGFIRRSLTKKEIQEIKAKHLKRQSPMGKAQAELRRREEESKTDREEWADICVEDEVEENNVEMDTSPEDTSIRDERAKLEQERREIEEERNRMKEEMENLNQLSKHQQQTRALQENLNKLSKQQQAENLAASLGADNITNSPP